VLRAVYVSVCHIWNLFYHKQVLFAVPPSHPAHLFTCLHLKFAQNAVILFIILPANVTLLFIAYML